MIFIIWGICGLFNYLYFLYYDLNRYQTIKIKDLFSGWSLFFGLLGPFCTFIIFIEEFKNLCIKLGNIEIKKAKK